MEPRPCWRMDIDGQMMTCCGCRRHCFLRLHGSNDDAAGAEGQLARPQWSALPLPWWGMMLMLMMCGVRAMSRDSQNEMSRYRRLALVHGGRRRRD